MVSVPFSKLQAYTVILLLLKITLLHRFFSRFLNCINGTKSRKTSHMKEQIKSI